MAYRDRVKLSDRIWKVQNNLGEDIYKLLDKAYKDGVSATKLAKDLEMFVKEPAKRDTTWGSVYPHLKNKRVDYNAKRLAQTYINHAYQLGTIEGCRANPNVRGLKWSSSNGGNVCPFCQALDGTIFTFDEAIPLDHPNGHCTLIPVLFDDWRTVDYGQRDGEVVYWDKDLVEQKGGKVDEKAVRKYQNQYRDREQYEKYKKILGKNAPENIDKFRDLKYNDSEGYNDLKADYRTVKAIEKNKSIVDKKKGKSIYYSFK